jgi:hypothetical protein
MKVLSKAEMKKVLGGVANVTCRVSVNEDNPCSGPTILDCGADLDTCQNQADGLCADDAYYDCCDSVTCKYT